MKRILFAAAVLLAGAAAARLVGGRPGPRDDPTPDEVGEARDGRSGADLEAGPRGRAPHEAARHGRGSIRGTVRRDGAPSAARIEVDLLSESHDRRTGPWTAATLRRIFEVRRPTAEAATRAEGDGRYVVEGLPPGIHRVTAIASDGARGRATVMIGVDGATVTADLALARGTATLSGRVVGFDGRPFAGVVFVDRVTDAHERAPWTPDPGTPVPLDAEGRFQVTDLERGEVVLTAILAGAMRVYSPLVPVPHDGEFVFDLGAGTMLLSGRVVADDDGTPVAGAIVTGGGTVPRGATAVARTAADADGRFEIRMPPLGGGLQVQAAGFAPARKALSGLPIVTNPVEFRLARGARLEGRVTAAADGTPVRGVVVRVIPGGRSARDAIPAPAATDADGGYVVPDLPAGEAVAFAEGAGWVSEGVAAADPSSAAAFTVTLAAGETATFDLRVVRGASATGTLRDAAGAPVAGAVVRAEGRQPPGRFHVPDLLERLGPDDTVTAADGRFAIQGLVAGVRYVFTADAPDGATARSPLLLASGERPLEVEIRLAAVRELTVLVLDDASGSPVAGADVAVSPADREVALRGGPARAATGADGNARVVVRAEGPLSVQASAEGYRSATPTPVPEGDARAVVRLKRGHVVSGRALLPDGSPAAGALVEARIEDDDPHDPWSSGCRADERGAFRLTYDSPGPKAVVATFDSGSQVFEGAAVGTAGGEPVELRLAPRAERTPPAGTLLVRVVEADGKPVPRAEVCLRGPIDRRESAVDGVVEFRAPERADSWIFVWDAATRDGSPLPLGPAQVGPVPATTHEVTVRLPPEQRIEGVVRGPDGKGVPGVRVTAEWGAETDPERGAAAGTAALTGATGVFRLRRVGSGECSLTAQVPPGFVPPEPVTARGGASGIEIRLRAAARVTVTVLDDEGRPVEGATVSARRIGSTRWSSGDDATTGADGVARPGWLDAEARYALQVRLWRDPTVLPHEQAEWTPSDTTVRLARAFTIRGVVRDRAGRPVPGARVTVPRDGTAAVWTADDEGRFELGGLPEGEHEVGASLPGAFGWPDPTVRVAAGTQDVVLTLDTGLDLVVRIENWPVAARAGQAPTLLAQGTPERRTLAGKVLPDGTVRFRGLEADRAYTLWVAPVGDGLSLLRRDVRAGTGDLRVTLSRGRTVTGRVVLPAGAKLRGVMATSEDGHLHVPGTAAADGRYEIRGLPEGSWSVEATATRGRERLRARADASAGGTVDLVIE